MRFPRDDDLELLAAINRFVVVGDADARRYLKLLHGNFLDTATDERRAFVVALAEAATAATDRELNTLLDGEWRSRLTAAWLIACDHRTRFRPRLRDQLLASELAYAGQGYCVAFARFGESRDADVLSEYLHRHLPQVESHFDQHWAIGALLTIDPVQGQEFLGPSGLWQQSAMTAHNPWEWKARIEKLLAALSA
jgi:Family of unknown function (DUF6000)